MSDIKRESGYYWVKDVFENWTIAYWYSNKFYTNNYWALLDVEEGAHSENSSDISIHEIGDKIEVPEKYKNTVESCNENWRP